jgi:hypothetical protein
MIRCVATGLAVMLAAATASAQVPRLFPAHALRGELTGVGTARRAAQRQAGAAGSRRAHPQRRQPLRGDGQLAGRKLLVHYTTEGGGQLRDIWILRPARSPTSPGRPPPSRPPAGSFDPIGADLEPAMSSPAKKVFIRTFGCQMNEYDSDKMSDVLRRAEGYEPTDDVEQADLILFNTCSVREKAQEKVFSDLGRVKHLKKPRAC